MNCKKHELTQMTREQIRQKFGVDDGQAGVADKNLRHKKVYAAAGGVSEIIFFNESVGNNGQTLATTNMEENGKLPVSKDFFLEGFEIRPFANAALEANRLLDLVALLNTGVLQLNYRDKPRFEDGPLINFVSRNTLIGVDATTGDSNAGYYMLRNPILIEGGKNFSVSILWKGTASPATTATVDLDVRLLGQEIAGPVRAGV